MSDGLCQRTRHIKQAKINIADRRVTAVADSDVTFQGQHAILLRVATLEEAV